MDYNYLCKSPAYGEKNRRYIMKKAFAMLLVLAMALGCLAGQTGKFGSAVAYSRCYAAPVKPVGPTHNFIKVEIAGQSLGHRASGTVVNYL